MLTMEDLMPRVEKGAAWLDTVKPGWFDAVDLDVLHLAYSEDCVLGQCFGDWDAPNVPNEEDEWFIARGFDVENGAELFDDDDPTWVALRECWVTVILSRRFAATAPSPDAVPVEVSR